MNMILLSSKTDNVLKFITTLIVFIFVLFLTYATTRWIGNYQKGHVSGKNIEYVEGFRLSNNKVIQIVRIGNEYVALAVCKDTVTLLTKLEKEDIILDEKEKTRVSPSFSAILSRMKQEKALDSDIEMNEDEENHEEENHEEN